MKPFARPAPTHDVITVGAAVIDEYAKSDAFELEKSSGAPDGLNACVPLGAKLQLSHLILETGGGATNAAVTFSRLGIKSAVISRVGKDIYGDLIRSRLHSEKVETTFIQRDAEGDTGKSIILVAGIGFRSILTHRGASGGISAKQVPWSKLRPRWFYVTALGGDLGLLSLVLHRAEMIGARVAWNPGHAELEKGLARLLPFIKRVDVFIVNREEGALLSHTAPRHLRRIVEKISGLPKVALLLSDGPKGAYISSRGCNWFCPALPGKRVNTTGAGDALGSGFVAGFLRTCDLAVGMKVGMLNALGVITHMGAKAGILRRWPTVKELSKVKVKIAALKD